MNETIPNLSEAYHKSRRTYFIVAIILAIWELVGFEVDKSFLASYGVSVRAPEAAPLIVFLLLIYYSFRTTVEWFQCHPDRRSIPIAQTDFKVAHALGIISLIIYSVQTLFDFKIFETISVTSGLQISLLFCFSALTIWSWKVDSNFKTILYALVLGVMCILFYKDLEWKIMIISIASGVAAVLLHPVALFVLLVVSLIYEGISGRNKNDDDLDDWNVPYGI